MKVVCSVGTAVMLGAYMARKKPILHCVLYPATAGGAVWAGFYMSRSSN